MYKATNNLKNALGPELPLLLLRRRPPVGASGRQDGAGSDGSDGHAPAQRHETQYDAQNKTIVSSLNIKPRIMPWHKARA